MDLKWIWAGRKSKSMTQSESSVRACERGERLFSEPGEKLFVPWRLPANTSIFVAPGQRKLQHDFGKPRRKPLPNPDCEEGEVHGQGSGRSCSSTSSSGNHLF